MSFIIRKPVSGNNDEALLGDTDTEDGWRLEILDLKSKGIVQYMYRKQMH